MSQKKNFDIYKIHLMKTVRDLFKNWMKSLQKELTFFGQSSILCPCIIL